MKLDWLRSPVYSIEGQDAPASATPADGGSAPSDLSVEDMFRRDPFAESEGEGSPVTGKEKAPGKEADQSGTGQPAGAKPGVEAEPAEGAAPLAPQPGGAAPAGTPVDPAELARSIAELRGGQDAILATMRAPQGDGGDKGPAPGSLEELQTLYDFRNIPEKVMSHLNSENPEERKAGLAAVMFGVAAKVHYNMLQHVQRMADAIPEVVMSRVAQQNAAREQYTDFYNKYPKLNRDELRPVVVAVAKQMGPQKGWTPALRDEIAKRTFAALGWQMDGAAPPAGTRPKAPRATPSAARPGGGVNGSGQEKSQADEVMDLLF